jgi:protein PhnA
MNNSGKCPKCNSENTYLDMNLMICPDCSHEWDPARSVSPAEDEAQPAAVRDSNGNALSNGDSVIVIKDLKVKGSSSGLKSGTKVKNIRIVDGEDGHNISCKIDGIGAMYLKSEFLRKA